MKRSSEKYFRTKIMKINSCSLFEALRSVQKYIICTMKPRFWSLIDFCGIINCNTFSVVPSIISENAKKCALPLKKNIK
jgi:hypothetical protein